MEGQGIESCRVKREIIESKQLLPLTYIRTNVHHDISLAPSGTYPCLVQNPKQAPETRWLVYTITLIISHAAAQGLRDQRGNLLPLIPALHRFNPAKLLFNSMLLPLSDDCKSSPGARCGASWPQLSLELVSKAGRLRLPFTLASHAIIQPSPSKRKERL